MENISYKNIMFLDLCRLCLDEQGICVILDIDDLAKNICTCMGIKIKEEDKLPKKICIKCLETINNFVQLKTVASRNNNHLRLLLFEDKEENVVDSTNTNLEEYEKDIISYNILPAESEAKFLSVRKDLFETSSTEPPDVKKESTAAEKSTSKHTKSEHTCADCSKVFKTWKKYYLHQRSHNKNLACHIDECNKKFATKGDLEKHLRAHTGEKPYKCNECDKSFSQRVSLKAHKINIHVPTS